MGLGLIGGGPDDPSKLLGLVWFGSVFLGGPLL